MPSSLKLTHLERVAWFKFLELSLVWVHLIDINMRVLDDENHNSKTQLVCSWHHQIQLFFFKVERGYETFTGENPSFNRTHPVSKLNHSCSTKAASSNYKQENQALFSNDIIYTLTCFHFKWFSVYARKVCSLFIIKLKVHKSPSNVSINVWKAIFQKESQLEIYFSYGLKYA